ncbi:MAG TPA: SPOR domain-containing protein [Albitalea sp.]|uniref:SPOR domain-containing protein n=1 Tax=Piscinibacter sp. TaxID=1903157 RepID=UPI002ED42412
MPVSSCMRFVIGGIGGLAPVAALLATVNLESYITDLTQLKMAGHIVKVVALFGIGGFIAWLHEGEDKLFKVFEIGLGAPALIAGLIATNTVAQSQPPVDKTAAAALLGSLGAAVGALVPSARAQTQADKMPDTPAPPASAPAAMAKASVARTLVTKRFAPPAQSGTSQFLEGLTGTQPSKRWYVIAGAYAQPEPALAFAREMNSRNPSLQAEVYAPSQGKQFYGVVLGADLTGEEAVRLRERAIDSGFPADTYIRSFYTLR